MRYIPLTFLITAFIFSLYTFNKPIGHTLEIQEEYKLYVQMFEQDSNLVGHPLVVDNLIITTQADLGGEIVAQCRKNYKTPKIVVNAKLWKYLDQTEREIVMLHEMGHCLLNRWHIEKEISPGVPVSIMHPYVMPPSVYLRSKEQYLKELFSK